MKRLSILLILLLVSIGAFAQLSREWNQYYFRFELIDKAELAHITNIVSIDNIRGNWVYAYANDDEWAAFQKLGLKTQLLPAPSSQFELRTTSSVQQVRSWDAYPTYDAYVAMMNQFAATYPNLCQIIDAGTTTGGRKILFAKISDNVSSQEAEPEVMYTSTVHGDETTGYMLMLRLIDTLLSGYGTDTRITNLVNNTELWINPNANPDGTYYGGNSTLANARRYNQNGYDINRNFPDQTGAQYSGQPLQTETTLMMNFANAHHFVLSANFHGGAEVVNYPWDYTYTLHPDNDWWVTTSLVYANKVQLNGPSGYFTGISSNGITNGAAWYVITGGRQDWMNYTSHCREVTIECSSTKMPAASTMPNYWSYNYDAMLSYLEQAQYGIHGIVTDPYGNPLSATITISGHDNSYSAVITDPARGDFYRFLSPGTYTLTVSASGYPDKTVSGVVVTAGAKTPLTVVMGELPHAQNLTLNPGWNLVSFNIDLGANGINAIFDNGLQQIKTQTETYSPLVPAYYNTMSGITGGKGYWVKNSGTDAVSVTGQLLSTATHSQALQTGWNLVSYLPDTAMSVSSALAGIIGNVMEVRSITASWTPGGGSLSQLEPGKAYWILVTNPCTLTYP